MGCPAFVNLGDNLVFSICTHDPETGILTDASAAPPYRVYESETATPILTGTMSVLDDVNTTGFYTETIACTTANGFEYGKTYTIYIEATVDGNKGGICYGFSLLDLDDIADAVWDEILTGATHNIATSAGRRLRSLASVSIIDGTATAGSTNSITLEAGASTTNNIYNENLIVIIGGVGAGQSRMIAEYDGGTLTAIVDRAWDITPTATSEYQIMAFSGILLLDHGTATAGTSSTITLATTASAVDGAYIGSMVVIATGTGVRQARLITAYDGGTKIATVSPDWTTTPTVTSVYKVIPVGRSIINNIPSDVLAQIADSVLDEVVESTLTLRQFQRIILAAVANKASGGGTTTIKFRDIADALDRITLTVDANGNRSASTLVTT